jgi:hypothetical protein
MSLPSIKANSHSNHKRCPVSSIRQRTTLLSTKTPARLAGRGLAEVARAAVLTLAALLRALVLGLGLSTVEDFSDVGVVVEVLLVREDVY